MAEKLMLDDISTGASGDIQQATAIARAMVTKYGMSDRLGPISFDSSDHSIFIGRDFGSTKSYSEKVAAEIDDEVKRIFDEATAKCEGILKEHRDILTATAEYLLENETMNGNDFAYMCEHEGKLPPAAEPEMLPPENPLMDEIRAEALKEAIETDEKEKRTRPEDRMPVPPEEEK